MHCKSKVALLYAKEMLSNAYSLYCFCIKNVIRPNGNAKPAKCFVMFINWKEHLWNPNFCGVVGKILLKFGFWSHLKVVRLYNIIFIFQYIVLLIAKKCLVIYIHLFAINDPIGIVDTPNTLLSSYRSTSAFIGRHVFETTLLCIRWGFLCFHFMFL